MDMRLHMEHHEKCWPTYGRWALIVPDYSVHTHIGPHICLGVDPLPLPYPYTYGDDDGGDDDDDDDDDDA